MAMVWKHDNLKWQGDRLSSIAERGGGTVIELAFAQKKIETDLCLRTAEAVTGFMDAYAQGFNAAVGELRWRVMGGMEQAHEEFDNCHMGWKKTD